MIQQTQALSIVDRVTAVFATWLVTFLLGKGYITTNQAAEYAPLLIAVMAAVYGWYKNRDKFTLQRASIVPGTVVITTPALALDTPDEKNIISNTATPAAVATQVKKAIAAEEVKP